MIGIILPLFARLVGKNRNSYNQESLNDDLINVAVKQVKTNDMLIDATKGLIRIQENNLKIQQSNLEIQKQQFKQRVLDDKREWKNEITIMENQLLTETNPHMKTIIEQRIEHFKKIEKEIPFE